MTKLAHGVARWAANPDVDPGALAAAISVLEANSCVCPGMEVIDPMVAGPLLIVFLETYLDIRGDHSSLIDAVIESE